VLMLENARTVMDNFFFPLRQFFLYSKSYPQHVLMLKNARTVMDNFFFSLRQFFYTLKFPTGFVCVKGHTNLMDNFYRLIALYRCQKTYSPLERNTFSKLKKR